MKNQKQKGVFPPQRDPARGGTTLLTGIIIIVAVAVIAFGGVFVYQYFAKKQLQLAEKALQTQQILNKPFSLAGEPTTQISGWETFYNKYKNTFEKQGGMFDKISIAQNTALFSPDNKFVSFIVVGYEYSRPYIVDTNSGIDILKNKNVWFSDPKKDVFWFLNGKLLIVKSTLNEFSGEGQEAIFVLYNSGDSGLEKIFSLTNEEYQNGNHLGNISFSNNKIIFSKLKSNGLSDSETARYSYDINTKKIFDVQIQTNQTAGWKTYKNIDWGIEFKYPSDWKITNVGNGFYIFLENPEGNFRMKIYKSVLGSETIGYEGIESKEILVDNYSATKSTIRGTGENVSKNYYAIITHISDKEFFYEGDIDSKNLEKFTENYDQILSTFKFTK